ncbi:insulinase family protein, partial [Dehalococcoidia bacterium]|nr:insulinase family protein [Dehalococcoidia bacterium]
VSADQIQNLANSVLGEHRVELTVNPQTEMSATLSNLDRSIMPKPQGQPRFVAPDAIEYTLNNGMKTLVIEKHELPVITFGLLLKNGAVSDPEQQPGLSYMTASMLTEGTETRSSQQIAEEFESLGTQIFTGTRREITTVNSESLTKHWPEVLKLTADIVMHPTFATNELTRVLREHLTDINRIQDDPTSLADRVTPMALYGANTPYGHPVSGTKTGIEDLKQTDLIDQYRSIYSPDAATFVIVGDVKASDVNTQIEGLFGKWGSDNPKSQTAKEIPTEINLFKPQKGILLLDKPGAPQSVLRIGHQSIPRSHPDYFAMSLIVYTLGGHFSSRLNKNLREDKGYTYGYRSWIEWQNPASLFISGGDIQTPNTGDAIQETILELKNLTNDHPVTAEELKDAKEGIIRSLPESFATTDQILGQIGELIHFDLPLTYFSEYGDRIENVTLEDTARVAKEQINLDQLTIVVVGDLQTIEPQIKDLGIPIKYIDAEGNVTEAENGSRTK